MDAERNCMAGLRLPYNTVGSDVMGRKAVSPEKSREYLANHKARDPEGYAAKRRQLNKEWIAKNRQRYNRAKSEYRFKLKLAAIDHYTGGSMACTRCGFDADLDALCLDHINDDGKEHRAMLRIAGRSVTGATTIYERLKALGWMDGLQVLCANCNTIKALRLKRGNTAAEMLAIVTGGPTRWKDGPSRRGRRPSYVETT